MTRPPARRRSIRVTATCPVLVTPQAGPAVRLATINVSARGVLLRDAPHVPLGPVTVTFNIHLEVPGRAAARRGANLVVVWEPPLGLHTVHALRRILTADTGTARLADPDGR